MKNQIEQLKLAIECKPVAKYNAVNVLTSISDESRISNIKLTVPKGVNGLKEGSHSLVGILNAISGRTSPIDADNKSASFLGDEHCSSLQILDRCQEVLYQFAETNWLQNAEIEISPADNDSAKVKDATTAVFIKGTYRLVDLVETLAKLTENAFQVRMNETPCF